MHSPYPTIPPNPKLNKVLTVSELLGVKLPIIQSPMAGVQDSELAIAVARAGGLGSLPCAMLSPETLESELQTINSAIDIPINLNFFCHKTPKANTEAESQWLKLLQPYFFELGIDPHSISAGTSRRSFNHDTADVLEPYAPSVVSFHFGLPSSDLVQRVKNWGATILSSATTANEALWLEENGVDLIIAQGKEAGGHRGLFLNNELETQSSTVSLLSDIITKVSLPVIAAGGISTADGVASSIKNGAIAAQLGTAYLLCDETKTSQLHRDAILANESPQTTLTNLFSGRPARGIVNRVIRELGAISSIAPQFPLAATAMAALRRAAESNGSSDFTPLWCGQNTLGCDQISAYELTLKLASKL